MELARDPTAGAGRGELDEVTAALEGLVETLDREDDLEIILQRVCQQVTVAVREADLAGVTRIRDGRPGTAAYTDEVVLGIDCAQYRSGGPCMEAAATGKVVSINVEDAAERWPEFTRAGLAAGVASYLSAPLVIDSEYYGALNLYSYGYHGFRDLDAALLELFTVAVEGALRSTRRYLAARELAEQLREALVSRAVIDQAKGILMAARGLTAEQAFAVLIEQSQRENVKVRDLASRFVAAITQPGGGGPS
jgi:GAF domain-containing protein